MKLIRVTQATAVSLLLTAALAACGGAADEDTDTDTATDSSPSAVQGAPDGIPGASGLVAAVSGRTAQVQSEMTGQVAVSWTADTTFTEEVDATLDDVTVGSCVLVGSDAEPGATEIAATSVRILDGCDDLAGGMPSGMPTDLPSDLPTDLPSDLPEGAGRPGGFGTVGEVSAVTAGGFTVTAMESEVTVTVSGDTTYTTTAEATDAAMRTGVCVTAQGETDDTGALTAASIGVSKPVDGQCAGGFMGRPGGAA